MDRNTWATNIREHILGWFNDSNSFSSYNEKSGGWQWRDHVLLNYSNKGLGSSSSCSASLVRCAISLLLKLVASWLQDSCRALGSTWMRAAESVQRKRANEAPLA